ncbi:MAG: Rossmann-like and DUF2520 domain-containing protein [Bacteroidales bacterium]
MIAKRIQRIVCIGAGNVAYSLVPALYGVGYNVIQICSRKVDTAKHLANLVRASCTDNIKEMDTSADLYILAVSDREIQNVLQNANFGESLVIHTSGSTHINVFEKYNIKHYGVLYPLQTLSQKRIANFVHIPLFIEAKEMQDMEQLTLIANKLSTKVKPLNSEQRMHLHISAVFACNFTNQMFAIAHKLLKQSNLDFEVLRPLINETVTKALNAGNPKTVQTGPAVREDNNIIQLHLQELLPYEIERNIYKIISDSIQTYKNQ